MSDITPTAYDMLLDELERVDARCETYLRAYQTVNEENEVLRRQLRAATTRLTEALDVIEQYNRVLEHGMMTG